MSSEVHPLTTEELAALGLLQMANRTAEMIDECQSLIQQADEVMATVTVVDGEGVINENNP